MSETEPDRRGAWAAAAVAFAAALVLYVVAGRVWSFGFVNYDDVYVLANENPAIGKGLVAGLPELLSPFRSPQFMNAWLPAYYWSLGLDHAIGGGAPWVFHLHSALLHAVGAAMVALIARRLGATAFVAGIAGVVFAVHPAATESVAWVASRKCSLSFVWMGASILCYLRGVERESWKTHAAGAICAFAALVSNGTTVVLPLLLFVHSVLLRPRELSVRTRLVPLVPYAVVTATLTVLHLWNAGREGTAGAGEAASAGTVLEVVARYATLLIAPLWQSVEHGVRAEAVDTTRAFLGGIVLVGSAVAVAATWRRSPRVAAVIVAVVVALLPFNDVFPRTSVLFAERYAYVALLPAAIGIAWLLRPRGDGFASLVPAALGVGLLGAATFFRLPVWQDSVALWTDASAKAPSSALVQCQLANALEEEARATKGDEAKALVMRADAAWRSAKALASTDLDRLRADTGIATLLLTTASGAPDPAKQLAEAIAGYDSAAALAEKVGARGIEAQRVQILTNRATCHEILGDNASAMRDWSAAVRLDGKCARGYDAIARIHLAAGNPKDAAEALAKSVEVAPHDPEIVRERAKIRLVAGDAAGAKKDLADAIAAHPQNVDLLLDAARLDGLWLRPVDAEEKLRKAMDLRPGDAEIRDLLAAALLDQAQSQAARDDMDAAREAARKAGEIAPHSSAPEQVLGIVSRRAGNLDEAAEHLRRARALNPEGLRIREQLASVLVELAVQMLDDKREALALMLLEEAVLTRATAVSTPKARLDTGIADWPPPVESDDRALVARRAALKALAYLGVGRAADAANEIAVAEAGTRGGETRLRRVVLRLLVRTYVMTGRADGAVDAAREFASLDIAGDDAWRWRREAEFAEALIERGTARRGGGDGPGAADDFKAAREALQRAKTAGMPEGRLHTRLGEILFREEEFLGATKSFDYAESVAPTDVEPVLDRAQVWRTLYLQEEDKAFLVQAERDFRAAAEIAPSDPRVLAGLGETLLMQQKPGDAFPWLQKAVLADPSQHAARKMLSDLAIRAGRSHLEKCAGAQSARAQQELQEARTAAERAVALDPPSPDALIFLGDVLRAQGDWNVPLAKYEEARRRFPGTSASADAIAKFHMDRGHFQLLFKKRAEAIGDFKRALDTPGTTIDLTDAKTWLHDIADATFREAMDLEQKGNAAEAAERFALSVFAEPTAEASFARGVLLGRIGKHEESIAAYDAVIALDPKMLGARLNRAGALLRVGRWDESKADYRTWLDAAPKDDPNRRAAEKQIEWIDQQQRELDQGGGK